MVAAGLLPDLDALENAEEEGAPVVDSTRLEDGFPEEEEEEVEEDFWSLPPKAGSSKLLYMREGSTYFFLLFQSHDDFSPHISSIVPLYCTYSFFLKKTMNSVCENRMSQIRRPTLSVRHCAQIPKCSWRKKMNMGSEL